jgi:hypothetical protein
MLGKPYSHPRKSQHRFVPKRSQGDHYAKDLSLYPVRGRVPQPDLSAAAIDALWPNQGERAARQKPLHSPGTLLPEVPSHASAHGFRQSIASPRRTMARRIARPCALLRTQEVALSPMAGSLRALSAGNAGEHPATSGAGRLSASNFFALPGQPQGHKRAPSPRSEATGERDGREWGRVPSGTRFYL